jgi:hypothetical protein
MDKSAEEKMIDMACNALTIAGQEMSEGDHWPIIRATVESIRKDFEELQTEREIFEEVRKHYEGMIRDLELMRAEAPTNLKPAFRTAIGKLRDICNATFAPVGDNDLYIDTENLPTHVKRAKVIIDTLEENDVSA